MSAPRRKVGANHPGALVGGFVASVVVLVFCT